ERQAGPYYLLVAGQRSFGNFRDVASFAGDAPIQHSLQIGAGWNSERFGTFGLAYTLQKSRQDVHAEGRFANFADIELVTGSWTYSIAKGWTAFASAYRSLDDGSSSGFMVGLSVSPSEGLVVDGGISGGQGSVGGFAEASQSPPTDGGF